MDVRKFIEPKEIEIEGEKYIISKIPAIPAQQVYRGIMQESKDDGDIALTYLSSETAIALLSYAAHVVGEEKIPCDSESQINVACPTLTKLIELEAAMIRYNFGFLFDGSLQKVLEALREGREI